MGRTGLVLGIVVAVLLVGFVGFFSFLGAGAFFGLFSAFQDQEELLKQQYNTEVSDRTDGQPFTVGSGEVSYNSLTFADRLQVSGETQLNLVGNTQVIFDDKNYKGLDLVFLVRGSGIYEFDRTSGGVSGFMSVQGVPLDCRREVNSYFTRCDPAIFEFIPSPTDDSNYLVKKDGVVVKEISVGDVFYLSIRSSVSGVRGHSFVGELLHFGSKSRFCGRQSDEVPVVERFSGGQITRDDLQYVPDMFCQDSAPPKLIDLQQGEDPLPFREGIGPLNRGDSIPVGRDIRENELLEVTYYVNVAKCEPNCQLLAPDEFYRIEDGELVKDTYTTEPEQRAPDDPEVVEIPGAQEIQLSGKDSYGIGDSILETKLKYSCSRPEGQIYRPPVPAADCYSSEVDFPGFNGELTHGQSTQMTENLHLQFFAGGEVREGSDPLEEDLSGRYILSVTEPIKITIENITSQGVVLYIRNNLPKGQLRVEQVQRVDVTGRNIEDTEIITIDSGTNQGVFLPRDTSELGIQNVKIETFFEIEGQIIRGPVVSYGVEATSEGVVIINEDVRDEEDRGLLQRFIDWLRGIFQ